MNVFVLKTQLPPSDEVRRECHDAPEEIDAELYLRSLADDINGLPIVRNVDRSGFVLTIRADIGIKQAELKAAMKPYFSGDRFCTLRFVSLEPVA